MSTSTYPARLDGRLDSNLSRGLWLIKWLLAIPHYVLLALLWLAFVVLTVLAFFSILFTGRYPRSIFAFNVGVLRWHWRVTFYGYSALGTDRYPPFTLDEVPDYPAHLSIDYPERLSRGLVLVKWWLLAIPHYLVLAILLGGGTYVTTQAGTTEAWRWSGSWGLLGLLVLIAAVALLFTGRYPPSLFDLLLGLNRWVLRVTAYAALLTDVYPPFRLDQGGDDPDRGHLAFRSDAPSAASTRPADPTAAAVVAPGSATTAAAQPAADPSLAHTPSRTWGPGKVVALVVGSLLVLISLALLAGSVLLGVADQARRNNAGFLTSGTQSFTTASHAIVSPNLLLDSATSPALPQRVIGDVNLTVTPANPKPVFVGIAPTRDVATYLTGVGHATVVRITEASGPIYRDTPGGAPAALPASTPIWAASSVGEGTRSLVWSPRTGDWTVVVMNADATLGVNTNISVGATLPVLGAGATALLLLGLIGLLLGAALLTGALLAARRAHAKAVEAPVR